MNTCTRWSVAVSTGLTLALGTASPAMAVSPAAAPAAHAGSSAVSSELSLPPGWSDRLDAAETRTGVERSPAAEAVRRAIDPDDYECGPTQLDAYIGSLLAGLDAAEIGFLLTSGVLDFPMYDALLFGSGAHEDWALLREYRQRLSGSFRDNQRFWDIESDDIDLMAMHGDGVLQDPARLARLLDVAYGLDAAAAAHYAQLFVAIVASIPEFEGGNNPIFTLNAFAFTAEGETHPLIATLPDKIVFGDGILDFFEHTGNEDVGPRVVMAHEFAHHVQFEGDLFDSPLTGPEATRRTELMADAMGTYYATHSRGLALNAKRVVEALQAFYEVGDCSYTHPGHHGTPLQRERAAQWGADLADAARKQGHILPSLTVAALFDAALPVLVAPDAG